MEELEIIRVVVTEYPKDRETEFEVYFKGRAAPVIKSFQTADGDGDKWEFVTVYDNEYKEPYWAGPEYT